MFFLYISLIVHSVTFPFFASPSFNLFKPHKNDWTEERNNFKKLTADLNNFEEQCNDWLIQLSPENLKIIEAFLDYLDLGNQNLLENKPERYQKIKTFTSTMRDRLFHEGSAVYLEQLTGYLNGLDEFLKKEFPQLPKINSYGLDTVETLIKKEQEKVKEEFGNLIQQKESIDQTLSKIKNEIETQTLKRNELLKQQKEVQEKQKPLQLLEHIKSEKDLKEQQKRDNTTIIDLVTKQAILQNALAFIEQLAEEMKEFNGNPWPENNLKAQIENKLETLIMSLTSVMPSLPQTAQYFKNESTFNTSFKNLELKKLTETINQEKKKIEEAIRTHASETDKLTPANLTQLQNLNQEEVTLGFQIDKLEKELGQKQTEFQKQKEELLRLQDSLKGMPQDTDYIDIEKILKPAIVAHNAYFESTFKESVQFYSTLSLHIFLVRWALYKCVRLPKFVTEKPNQKISNNIQFKKSISRHLKEAKASVENVVNTFPNKSKAYKTEVVETKDIMNYYYDPSEKLKLEFNELQKNIFDRINSIIQEINEKIESTPSFIQNSIISLNKDFKQLHAWFNNKLDLAQINQPAKNAIVKPDSVSKLQQECIESFLKNMADFIETTLQEYLTKKNQELQKELQALSVNNQTENPLIKSDQNFLKEIDLYLQNFIMTRYFEEEILQQYKGFFAKNSNKGSIFSASEQKLMNLGLELKLIQRGIVISYLNYFAKPLKPDEMPKLKNNTPKHQPVFRDIEQIAKDIVLWQGIDCFKNIFPWICNEIVNNKVPTSKLSTEEQQINLAELQFKPLLESALKRINSQSKSGDKLFQKFNELLLQKEEWQKTADTCEQKRTGKPQ